MRINATWIYAISCSSRAPTIHFKTGKALLRFSALLSLDQTYLGSGCKLRQTTIQAGQAVRRGSFTGSNFPTRMQHTREQRATENTYEDFSQFTGFQLTHKWKSCQYSLVSWCITLIKPNKTIAIVKPQLMFKRFNANFQSNILWEKNLQAWVWANNKKIQFVQTIPTIYDT